MNLNIKKLYIDQSVADCDETAFAASRIGAPAQVVTDLRPVYQEILSAEDPELTGKSTLILTANRGRFIKKCPGTRYYNCCGYEILHVGTFCVMDCSYCILQTYFHPPVLHYFVNHQDLVSELDDVFKSPEIRRFGTGEFTDSLIWEKYTNVNALLIPKFASQSRSVLELKTKTTAIDHLEHFDHNGKTIISWSLNTERIINSEERHTRPLRARIDAARKCQGWGYPLAFHFDPLVIYEGCEEEYKAVFDQLFSSINTDNIVWISLGTFRFMPDLKAVIQRRFAKSKIVYGEFISGLDNKMRYFKPLRLSLYQTLIQWIKAAAPDVLVYFCMEDDEIWRKTLGFTPDDRGGLGAMLNESARRHCRLTD